MKKHTTLVFTFCLVALTMYSQDCGPSTASIVLDANRVKAELRVAGDLWWNPTNGTGKYLVPVPENGGQEVSALFTGGLWLAGLDPANNQKVAITQYPQGIVTDFYPGPLSAEGEIGKETCADWDRFFKVTKEEVEAHMADYADDGVVNSPLNSIFEWPGRDNESFEFYVDFPIPLGQELAPFADIDNDGKYEPEDGEYPEIKGDQGIWWVFNDAGNQHFESNADKLQAEVQVLAYAYDGESDNLDLTTFYDYKIINKAPDDLFNYRVGIWMDPDLGCYTDDYVGYDADRKMAYIYNEDAIDGNVGDECVSNINTYGDEIPMVGVSIIKDNFGENSREGFLYVNNASTGTHPGTLDPQNGAQAYNILNNLWPDGTPVTYGGNGYDPTSTNTTTAVFTGDPDDPNGWSMCSEDLPFGDRRIILTDGSPGGWEDGTQLTAGGGSVSFTLAVITVEDVPHPCPSLEKLQDAFDEVKSFVNVVSDVEDVVDDTNFDIHPNPTEGSFSVSFANSTVKSFHVSNSMGQVINTISTSGRSYTTVEMVGQLAGIYFVSALNDKGEVLATKKLVLY